MKYAAIGTHRTKIMGCAMVFVMLFHFKNNGLTMKTPILNALFSLGFGGVDLFVFLSAMGITISLLKNPTPYKTYMKKRFARILPAYYAVMIPYTLCLVLFQKAKLSWLFLNASLLYYWFPSGIGKFNWYISVLFLFYAVAPFLVRALAKAKRRIPAICVLIVASLLLTQFMLYRGYWNFCDFLYRIPIFLMGILVGFFCAEDRALSRGDLFAAVALGALGILYLFCQLKYGASLETDLPCWIHLPLAGTFLFTTLPVSLLLSAFFEKVSVKPLGFLLETIGKSTLEIYLLNVTLFASTALFRRFLPESPTMRGFFLIIAVANLLSGIGLHFLIEGIRRHKRKNRS